jgi:cyclin T
VVENAEEGEMLDEASPILNSRKRKGGSPLERQLEGKKRHDHMAGSMEDGHRMSRVSYGDREHRRHSQENHL